MIGGQQRLYICDAQCGRNPDTYMDSWRSESLVRNQWTVVAKSVQHEQKILTRFSIIGDFSFAFRYSPYPKILVRAFV